MINRLEVESNINFDKKILLTVDQDWAPDWQLDAVLSAHLRSPIVFFATNLSDWVAEVALRNSYWSIGIHPNFETGSSHGNSPAEVLSSLLKDFPKAKIWRSHSLMQSNRIYQAVADHEQLAAASNLYDSEHSFYNPINFQRYSNFTEFPICWEDDIVLSEGRAILPCQHHSSYHCYNFHVQHIITNAKKIEDYELQREAIYSAKETQIVTNPPQSGGIADVWNELVELGSKLMDFREVVI